MAVARLFPTARAVGMARLARWIAVAVAIVAVLACAGALTGAQASRSLPAAPVAAVASSGHDCLAERFDRSPPESRPHCVQPDGAQADGEPGFEPSAVFDVDDKHASQSGDAPAFGVGPIDFPIGSAPNVRGEPRVHVTRFVSGGIFSRGPPV